MHSSQSRVGFGFAVHAVDLHAPQARPVAVPEACSFGCRWAPVVEMNEVKMARNQDRKHQAQLDTPPEEETTSVRSHGRAGRAMHDVLRTPDDEKIVTRLGPEQEASVAFDADGARGDAGAEFAEDFGRDFLTAATTGDDIGEIQSLSSGDAPELGEPFLQVIDELDDLTEYAEPVDEDPPRPPPPPRR
jgi:hypothetical protein